MFTRKIAVVCLATVLGWAGTDRAVAEPTAPGDTATKRPSPDKADNPAHMTPLRIVVGFMGGRVKPSNLLHKEAIVAQDLRQRNIPDLHVFVFANHSGSTALRSILQLIDRDGNHRISETERKSTDIAIYGHSWGASEAIQLARLLQEQEIPVALTIQVDSVQKSGENDREIPPNVHEAVNLFQRDGLLRGRASIYAEDPSRTPIVLNEQYHYGSKHTINITRFPWFARTFMRQHIMIENDPEVWDRVEDLLQTAMLAQNDASGAKHLAAAQDLHGISSEPKPAR